MTSQTKQFIVSVRPRPKTKKKATFFQLASKDIVKSKNRKNRHLSEQVDQIVYGV